MPRGRSTFTKRQKEQTRQQKQRDKAERRSQRKQEELVAGNLDEMDELRRHAAEQAALFNLGGEDTDTAKHSSSGDRVDEGHGTAGLLDPECENLLTQERWAQGPK